MKTKVAPLVIMLLMFPYLVLGQSELFFTLNTVKARPLGMGGAYIAMDDDLASITYNPAGYFANVVEEGRRVTFFVNPLSPFIAGIKRDEIFHGSGSTLDDFLLSLSLLMKSVSISVKDLQIGLLFGEENLFLPEEFGRDHFFAVSGFRQNHTHSVISSLRLANEVSVGGTANLMVVSDPADPSKRQSKIGFSYGILLKPEEGLNIGVAFFNLPDDSVRHFRAPLERIVDESVNIGISYRLSATGSQFSVDLRDLGEESQDMVREFHFGYEQTFLSQFALRAGFFRKRDIGNVYSLGFGLFNGSRLFDQESQYDHFFLNYAFVYEETTADANKWHFLTLTIRR